MPAAASVAHAGGWRASHLLIVALGLLIVDLAPANLASTYVTHRGEKESTYAKIEESLGAGRYLELPRSSDGTVRSSYWHYVPAHRVACVGGPFIQGAPRSFGFRAAMIDSLAAVLSTAAEVPESLRRMLALENVAMVAVSSPAEILPPGMPPPDGFELDPQLPAWRTSGAAPVSLLGSVPAAPLERVPRVHSLGIESDSPGNRPASRRVVAAALSWISAADPVPVGVTGWRQRLNAVDFELADVGAGTLRIALAGYPTTVVRLDGVRVDWREGPLGGILLDVAPGAHRLSVEVHASATRKYLGLVLLVVTAVVTVMCLVPARGK